MSVSAIILAGGNSSRFKSPIPKVLYPLLEKPLIEYLLDTLKELGIEQIIIVSGARTDHGLKKYENQYCTLAFQKEALGTFDALLTGFKSLEKKISFTDNDHLLVLNADTPLVKASQLKELLDSEKRNAIITRRVQNPQNLGRIFRDKNNELLKIVEEKELQESQRALNEINAGIYKINCKEFQSCQTQSFDTKEQYLTSYLGSYLPQSLKTQCLQVDSSEDWTLGGINSFEDLEYLEKKMLQSARLKLLEQGAILTNIEQITVIGDVQVQAGVKIMGPCVLRAPLNLKAHVQIEPFNSLATSQIQSKSIVHSFCHIEQSDLGSKNHLGPFLRLRDRVSTQSCVHLGNFLEVKHSEIQRSSKAKHFGYIGQAHIGHDVNIGAGTIFCNYDGKRKHSTTVGDHSFIGSATQLVAPLTVGQYCYIGASTLLTQSLDDHSMATRRAPIKTVCKKKAIKE